jgi:hypothetical protein
MIARSVSSLETLGLARQPLPGRLRESADIMVDFYDDQGFLLCTDRSLVRRTATSDDVMNSGATAVLKVTKPAAAKT